MKYLQTTIKCGKCSRIACCRSEAHIITETIIFLCFYKYRQQWKPYRGGQACGGAGRRRDDQGHLGEDQGDGNLANYFLTHSLRDVMFAPCLTQG